MFSHPGTDAAVSIRIHKRFAQTYSIFLSFYEFQARSRNQLGLGSTKHLRPGDRRRIEHEEKLARCLYVIIFAWCLLPTRKCSVAGSLQIATFSNDSGLGCYRHERCSKCFRMAAGVVATEKL